MTPKSSSQADLRLFVPSAAALLTDHRPHGEGLIAHRLLSYLGGRGVHIVACAREVDLESVPSYEAIEIGAGRSESLAPLVYERRQRRVFERFGGVRSFDITHWIFPQDPDDVAFRAAPQIPLVIGPWMRPRAPSSRAARPGDVVRALVRPMLARRYATTIRCSHALLATPEAAEQFRDGIRPGSMQVLPFAVDPTRFAVTALPDPPLVLYVGRMDAEKSLDVLLDAFAAHAAQLPAGTRLALAGEGDRRPALMRRAADLGIEELCSFLGALPAQDIPATIARSSLLVLPSTQEPFGMVLLEAMAAGRAIVAADAGGPRSIVEDPRGGRLVEPGSPRALGKALVELLEDPDALADAGRANRALVEARYAFDVVGEQLLDLYRSLSGGALSSSTTTRNE